MRKVFLLLSVLVICKISQAQQKPFVVISPSLKFPDSVLVVNVLPNNNRKQPNFENMPNPYSGLKNQLTIIGNNGNGFDLYRSTPDNMVVAKPDSSNLAITFMPNGFSQENNMTILKNPRLNILSDTLSGIKRSQQPATVQIIK